MLLLPSTKDIIVSNQNISPLLCYYNSFTGKNKAPGKIKLFNEVESVYSQS